MADVTVTEAGRVIKDGRDIGTIVDVVQNGVATPSEVQSAFTALLTAKGIEIQEAQQKADKAKADADKAKSDAETVASNALKTISAKKAKEALTGKGKKWEAYDEIESELNTSAKQIHINELEARKKAIEKDIEDAKK